VDVAAVAGEAARQDSMLHPVGSDALQVGCREGCQTCDCQFAHGLCAHCIICCSAGHLQPAG
jgi:hypothetical protein